MCITTKSKQTILDSIRHNGIILSEEERNTLYDKLNNYTRYNLRVTKDKHKVHEEAIDINDIHIDTNNQVMTKYIRRTFILKRYNNNFRKGFMNSYLNEITTEDKFNINASIYPDNEKQVFIIEDNTIYKNTRTKTVEVIVYILSNSVNYRMNLS